MPIVFQSPDPVMPGASAGAGFAETWSKLFPAIASLYGHSMSNQAQAQMQNAQQTQNAQQFDIAQRNQAQGQSQALQAQADQTQYQATQQSELLNQKAQNEAWLNQQALSQSDTMQQSRLQNHLSWLQGGEAQNNLTPEQIQGEMNDTIQKLSYFQKRSQNATNNGIEQQGSMTDRINALGLTRSMADTHAMSQRLGDMVVEKKLSNGATLIMTPDGKGGWKEKTMEAADSTEGKDNIRQSQLADARYKLELQHRDTDKRRWDDAHMKVTKQIEEQAGMIDKETGKPAYPNLAANPRTNAAGERGEGPGTRTIKEWNYGEQMNKMGYGEDPEAYLAREAQKRAAMRGETLKQGGNVASPGRSPSAMAESEPPQSGQVQNQGAAGPQAQPKPFRFDQEKKTPEQVRTTDVFKRIDQQIADTGLHITDPQVHLQARVAEGHMKDLIQKYGSPEAMEARSPKDFDLWQRANRLVENIITMAADRKARAAQPAASPRAASPEMDTSTIASWRLSGKF
jgi:hypothetical protein